MWLRGEKSLKVVDDVVLWVDFWSVEGYGEASEVEGEGGAVVGFELGPSCAGLWCAVYASDDEHGAGGQDVVGGEQGGGVDVVECGAVVCAVVGVVVRVDGAGADVCAGPCGAYVAEECG